MSWVREIEAARDVDDLRTSLLDDRETLSQLRDAGRQERNSFFLLKNPDELEPQEASLLGRADSPKRTIGIMVSKETILEFSDLFERHF